MRIGFARRAHRLAQTGARVFVPMVAAALAAGTAAGQSISPIIAEYAGKGEGRIELSNNTLSPLVVQLEAQSFTIDIDGKAIYRPLDKQIEVQLSTTSVRLEPRQQYYVFYKAKAAELPAWFTVYATFSSPQRGPGVNVRIMLPHTVYLYQKKPLLRGEVHVGRAAFQPDRKRVVLELENTGAAYGRMREGSVRGGRDSASVNGFPLLPGASRRVVIPWTVSTPPREIVLHFDHFEIKTPVSAEPAPEGASG